MKGLLILDNYPTDCDECDLKYGDRCVVTNLDVGVYVDYLEKYEKCPIQKYEKENDND